MISDLFLQNKDYTVYNALTWGNCLNHARKAWKPATPSSHRILHGTIALVELIPVISQIASLFEMAIASAFKPSLASLAKREIRHIHSQEPDLPHQVRTIVPFASSPRHSQSLNAYQPNSNLPKVPTASSSASSSSSSSFASMPAPLYNEIDVVFPSQIEKLHSTLFPLHRKIESQYQTLPWPAQLQKIVVLTHVKGGRGDVVAAAKAIALMQKLCPTLTFDWVFLEARTDQYDPRSFLNCEDPSKVRMRGWGSEPPEATLADFVLTGPARLIWNINSIENYIRRKIAGPVFGFMENAETSFAFYLESLQEMANQQGDANEIYCPKFHFNLFPPTSGDCVALLPMGLQPASGVFLDQSRIEAPLSRGYCCPSYLPQIQDADLRQDILEAMNVFDGVSEPNYDQHSFNSGYAHWPASWGKFIDCVALHEKNKHVVIVLNQQGEYARLSTQQFQDLIFTPERLAFLKQKGYGTVLLKGKESELSLLQESEDSQLERRLIVIVRSSFIPNDMRCMQLASERLLATGDNSAVESWCARCKLYLYEDIANLSCKWRFLQQQVDLAQTISPNLSRLLALFGGDRRIPDRSINEPLNRQKMAEIEELLNDPNLSDATLQFCDHITANYSFYPVLEAALKRTAWHHCIPQLAEIEAEALDESFRTGLIDYLRAPETCAKGAKTVRVRNIPEMGKRIQEIVQKYSSDSA